MQRPTLRFAAVALLGASALGSGEEDTCGLLQVGRQRSLGSSSLTASGELAPEEIFKLHRFGTYIEGGSVDPWGNLYASDFRSTNDNSTAGNNAGRNVIGRVSACTGESATWFTGEPNAVFNGMKWDRTGRAVYLADVGQGKVVKVDTNTLVGVDFCTDPAMKEAGVPNDLALSKTGLLFLSGQDWTSSSGALWLCNQDGKATLLEGMGRTNGIALSPDDSILYLTEARGSPVPNNTFPEGQRIWKYHVGYDGRVSNKTLFWNFATDPPHPEAATDADGMRTDTAGNLYVTRNGLGKVAVITPEGKLLREINVSTTKYPSNLAFGGKDGKTLYVVGRCGKAPWSTGDGCVDVAHVEHAGREWSWFRAGA